MNQGAAVPQKRLYAQVTLVMRHGGSEEDCHWKLWRMPAAEIRAPGERDLGDFEIDFGGQHPVKVTITLWALCYFLLLHLKLM